MKNLKWKKGLISLVLICIIIISGTSIYAEYSEEENTIKNNEPATVEIDSIEISNEMSTKLIETNASAIDIYKSFLVEYNVQTSYQAKIEELIKSGESLEEIMTAYAYIEDKFGKETYLTWMLEKRSKGESWKTIFTQYAKEVPTFEPSNFDQVYLQDLLAVGTVSTDDVMIADQIAQSAGVTFEEIMDMRIDGKTFKAICMELNLLGSKEKIPHVSITMEELNAYIDKGYEEASIINGYVIAMKVEKTPQEIITRMAQGITEAELLADYYTNKFDFK